MEGVAPTFPCPACMQQRPQDEAWVFEGVQVCADCLIEMDSLADTSTQRFTLSEADLNAMHPTVELRLSDFATWRASLSGFRSERPNDCRTERFHCGTGVA